MSPLQGYLYRLFEKAFVLFAFLILMEALSFLYRDVTYVGPRSLISVGNEGNRTFQLIMLGIFAVSGVMLLYEWRRFVVLLRGNLLVIAFVCFAVLSTLWAVEPELVMRRSFALAGTTLFGFYVVARYSWEEFLEILGLAAGGLFVLTLVFFVAFPSAAIDPTHEGAFAGLQGQKNDFGAIMVLSSLSLWSLRSRPGIVGILGWTGFIACLAFVFLSQSRSAWLVAGGLYAVGWPILRGLRNRTFSKSLRLFFIGLMGVSGFIFAIIQFYVSGLELIGRDASLTNRTFIWEDAISRGLERPFLGYGFNSFWESEAGIELALYWNLTHAHNGYIDIWLSVGFVGLALFLSVFLVMIYRVIREALIQTDPNFAFFPMFVFLVTVYNLVRREVPEHSTLEWVVFICTMLYCATRYPEGFWKKSQ